MSRGPKITFIGAGSARWTSRILSDIFMNEDLRGSEIWLMDINDYRLNIVSMLAKRYIEELKLPMKIRIERRRLKTLTSLYRPRFLRATHTTRR